jgi:zinc and cadmium transporter
MSLVWTYTLLSVVIVSLISLIGVFTLAMDRIFLQKILLYMVSFAVGALLGDAFIHLLPETFEKSEHPLVGSLLTVSGMMIFFVLEKFIRWRHCHSPTTEDHPHPLAWLNLFADAVHNFIDGVVIGASYIVSLPLGLTTTLAVVLHEIPQEMGDFGILVYGGFTTRKALFYNFITALTSVLGGVLSLLVGPHLQGYAEAMLPITAGGFIYIASTDLVPELHHGCETTASQSILQFLLILFGIGLMALLLVME